jgi:drug/metabolite transporter (DMT)-like permease
LRIPSFQKAAFSLTRRKRGNMFFYKPVHLKKGIALVLFAWLMFTLLTGMTRYTSKVASVPMMLFFQNLISLLFVVPLLIKHHYDLKPKRFGLILVRALTGVFGFGCLFLAKSSH